MEHIMAKFAAQAKKMKKIKERDLNKPCVMCREPMRKNGFSSIPRICKRCENERVHGDKQ